VNPSANVLILEQYDDWLSHPVTVRLNQYLRAKKQEFLEAWGDGRFTAESDTGTLQLNANALGQVEILTRLLDLQPDDFLSENQQ
jgi:hypothetical protein